MLVKLSKLVISSEQILYFEADGSYTSVYTSENRELKVSYRLKIVESKIPTPEFIRCQRSYIVNKNHIHHFDTSKMIIVLKNGNTIPFSEKYIDLTNLSES